MIKYINLHTHSSSQKETVIEVVNQYPWEFNQNIKNYSIGIHPWYIEENRLESDLKLITEKVMDSNCLALGECGLDKRIEIPIQLQEEIFKKQLELLQETVKPVILHCVAAFQEVIAIKKELKVENPMIVHGFSKNNLIAQSLLDHGFYLSFGKYLLQNPDLESVFKTIPNNRFFLETDSSNYKIEEVYDKAAHIKGITITELKQIVKDNFEYVFQKKIETI